jgi:hypothetical protein
MRAGVTGLALVATTGLGFALAQPASAAWAHNLGAHTVCADSLTLHLPGGDGTLGRGARFDIEHFADSGNHAWGWDANNRYGWVYNGWFC